MVPLNRFTEKIDISPEIFLSLALSLIFVRIVSKVITNKQKWNILSVGARGKLLQLFSEILVIQIFFDSILQKAYLGKCRWVSTRISVKRTKEYRTEIQLRDGVPINLNSLCVFFKTKIGGTTFFNS